MNKINKKFLSLLAASTFIFGSFSLPAKAAETNENSITPPSAVGTNITRFWGNTRYETSVAISSNWSSSDYVIVVSGEGFADALCAAPLAKMYNAPILLTPSKELNVKVSEEIKRLSPNHILIIGGTGSVSDEIKTKLEQIAPVERIFGSTRYETSLAVAKKLGDVTSAVITYGRAFPDSLSIAPIAAENKMPIILSEKEGLSAEALNYLSDKKISKTYIIGGEGVLSKDIENSVKSPVRLSGANRYDTNVSVLKQFEENLDFSNIYIAAAYNDESGFADALSGAALAAKNNSAVILSGVTLPESTASYMKSIVSPYSKISVLGGEGVLPSSIVSDGKFVQTVSNDGSTIGGSDSTSPTTFDNNINIVGNNITLKNAVIPYSIYVQGNNTKLSNVTVKGSVYINPGAQGSVSLDNISSKNIVVLSGNVKTEANSTVPSLKIEPFSKSSIITLAGSFKNIFVNKEASLNIAEGSNISAIFANTDCQVSGEKNSKINSIQAYSGVKVTALGEASKVTIKAIEDMIIDDEQVPAGPIADNITFGEQGSVNGPEDSANPMLLNLPVDITGDNISLRNAILQSDLYVHGNNATLTNLSVNGTIYLDPGPDGTVDLYNVTAANVQVLSGAENSIHFNDVKADNLYVDSSSKVRIVSTGTTKVGNTVVTSYAVLDSEGGTLGTINLRKGQKGEVGIELDGTFDEPIVVESSATVKAAETSSISKIEVAPDNAQDKVVLEGIFKDVEVNKEAKVQVAENTVVENSIKVNTQAEITASSTSSIAKVDVSPENKDNKVTLTGSFKAVEVNKEAKLDVAANTTIRDSIKVTAAAEVSAAPTASVTKLEVATTSSDAKVTIASRTIDLIDVKSSANVVIPTGSKANIVVNASNAKLELAQNTQVNLDKKNTNVVTTGEGSNTARTVDLTRLVDSVNTKLQASVESDKAEVDRVAAEKAAAEKVKAEKAAQAARAAAEKAAAEAKTAAERAAAEARAAEARAAAERAAAERAAAERAAAERAAAEKAAKDAAASKANQEGTVVKEIDTIPTQGGTTTGGGTVDTETPTQLPALTIVPDLSTVHVAKGGKVQVYILVTNTNPPSNVSITAVSADTSIASINNSTEAYRSVEIHGVKAGSTAVTVTASSSAYNNGTTTINVVVDNFGLVSGYATLYNSTKANSDKHMEIYLDGDMWNLYLGDTTLQSLDVDTLKSITLNVSDSGSIELNGSNDTTTKTKYLAAGPNTIYLSDFDLKDNGFQGVKVSTLKSLVSEYDSGNNGIIFRTFTLKNPTTSVMLKGQIILTRQPVSETPGNISSAKLNLKSGASTNVLNFTRVGSTNVYDCNLNSNNSYNSSSSIVSMVVSGTGSLEVAGKQYNLTQGEATVKLSDFATDKGSEGVLLSTLQPFSDVNGTLSLNATIDNSPIIFRLSGFPTH